MKARMSIVIALLFVACGGDDKGGTNDTSTGATEVTPTETSEATETSEPTEVMPTETSEPTEVAEDTTVIEDSEVAVTETSEPTEVIVVETDVTTTSCITEGHAVGEHYAKGDDCNFCDCNADGSATCSNHTCVSDDDNGCTYDGRDYPFAARFDAGDDCNECVCAMSGLACTRRCANAELEANSAELLESLDDGCAGDPTFTARAILDTMPYKSFETDFTYDHHHPFDLYNETLPPTTIRVTIAYEEGGFIACRNPNENQPSIDLEVTIEMVTADGSFDEGFHSSLTRNNFGFLDAWLFAIGLPKDGVDGSYDPNCLDPKGFSIGFLIYNSTGMVGGSDPADHHAEGDIAKACETDLALTVGTFVYTPE